NPLETLFLDKYTIHGSKQLQEMQARGKEIDVLIRDYKDGRKDFSAQEYTELKMQKKSINDTNKLVNSYLSFIKDKDEAGAEKLLPEIFRRIDAYNAGDYGLEKDALKDLAKESKKLMRV